MKNNKASFKSFRKKVINKEGVDAISPGIRHGETLIPNGSSNATIELPETKETFTYEIINSDSMTGNIKVAATEGSLKGLVLNSDGGTLNIAPVPVDCKQIQFESTMTDGSYIHTLSDGSDWFLWSFGFGSGLGVSTNRYIRGNVGLIGGGSGTVFEPIVLGPTYEPVIITSSVVTVEYPGGVATHDISFSGTAEPGSTLKIFDSVSTEIGDTTVANDGSWSFTVSGLINGQHEYTFKAFVGGSFINQSASWSDLLNGGLISFSCSQIQVEVGSTTPDFATEPVIYHQDSSGVQTSITDTTVVSTTYLDTSAAGTTFDVVFEFTYDSVTYQRTVTGNTIVNLVQPALPTISTVDGNASGVPISVTIADISGTALPNADVIVWVDGASTSTSVTADGTGQWTISFYDFGFTNNQTIVLYAQQQTVNGTLWSNNSTQFNVVYEQNVLAQPAVTDIAGLNSGGFTNNIDPLTINGTGVVGATVTVASAGSTLTTNPSTITVDSGGDWTTELPSMSDETLHTITTQQSKAGFTQSQQSTGFIINVDRTPPVLAAVSNTVLRLPNFADTLPTATDFSSVVVTAAYSPALVGAENDYSATYTATDQAGNTATNSRTITITTQPIIPEITSVTDNGDGTATIYGDVSGTYADNLVVKIYVTDGNGLETVYQESGTDVEFAVNSGVFSAPLTLSANDYTFQATTVNSEDEESSQSQETSQVTIAAAPDTEIPVITLLGNTSESFEEDGSYSDEGATAFDGDDGDITSDIVTTIVDAYDVTAVLDSTTAPGVYTIRYDVSDSSNNDADRVTRTVEVVAASSFLENLSSITLHNNATISSGIFSRNKVGIGGGAHGANFNLVDEGIVAFNSDGTRVEEELTVSFWFRPDETWANNWYYIGGHSRGTGTDFKLAVRDNSGFLEFRSIFFSGDQYRDSPSASALNVDEWYHLAVTYSANGSNHDLKMFVNGEKVEEDLNLTGNLMKMTNATKDFALGGYTSGASLSGNTLDHSSDSWQIASGTALTESQVAAIYNQSDRLMTITTASGL